MEESFIVVTAEEEGRRDARFSLWPAAGEAEAQVRRLVEQGMPTESIRVFRAHPMMPRRPAPVAARA